MCAKMKTIVPNNYVQQNLAAEKLHQSIVEYLKYKESTKSK